MDPTMAWTQQLQHLQFIVYHVIYFYSLTYAQVN